MHYYIESVDKTAERKQKYRFETAEDEIERKKEEAAKRNKKYRSENKAKIMENQKNAPKFECVCLPEIHAPNTAAIGRSSAVASPRVQPPPFDPAVLCAWPPCPPPISHCTPLAQYTVACCVGRSTKQSHVLVIRAYDRHK
jgi:hypothetical protein